MGGIENPALHLTPAERAALPWALQNVDRVRYERDGFDQIEAQALAVSEAREWLAKHAPGVLA